MRLYAAVTRRLPGPLRAFPFNVYLRDVRAPHPARAGRSSDYLQGSCGRLRGGTLHSVMRG